MKLHSVLNKGRGRRRVERRVAMLAAVGIAMLGGIAFTATSASAMPDKVWVCKYVGTPGVNESLLTGQGPIPVATSSIEQNTWDGTLPGWFSDKQDSSFVLAYITEDNTSETDPPKYTGVPQCPAGRMPIVTVTFQDETTCIVHRVRSVTTTIGWVYRDGQWVQDSPVITYGEWVNSVPTAEQLAGLDCTRDPIVTVTSEQVTTCTIHSVRSVTTTTEWVKVNGEWVKGVPVITYGAWVNSVPTAGQLNAAGLDCSIRLIGVTPEATATLGDCRGAGRVALGNNMGYSWSGNTGSSDSPTYTATANAGYKLSGTGVFTFSGLSQLPSDSAACAVAPPPLPPGEVQGNVVNAPVKAPAVLGIVADAPPAAVAGPGTLAFTGAETVPLGSAGLIMLAVGIALTAAGRRRSGQRVRG